MTTGREHHPLADARLRLTVILVVVCCLFLALFARLWFLQVVNAPSAEATASDQGVDIVYIQAPRGEILDRDGNVLVGNRSAEVIEVTDRLTALYQKPLLTRLATLVGMTVKQVRAAVNNTDVAPYYSPAIIETDAPASEILYIQEHQTLFAGVKATTETVPDYSTYGAAAANMVGYVGQINQAEYRQLKSQGYQLGFEVGQTGIEATYNSVLAGTPGIEKVQVNSEGQVLSVLSSTPPVPGDNIELTIDGKLQQTAVTAVEQGLAAAKKTYDNGTNKDFKAPAGSAVVEDPQNGQILALATYPDYNPDEFTGGISQKHYNAYNTNPNDPLLDRAIQGEYAPGSTFKLVTATAGLEEGIITPTSIYHDVGEIVIGGETFLNDDHEIYGPIDLPEALEVSSDNFFNNIGIKQWDGYEKGTLPEDAEQKVAAGYGFGSPTGIKLPSEYAGLVPTPAILKKQHQQAPSVYQSYWTTGDSAQIAIGQFEDEVTPLQLANAYSGFANGGTLYTPQIAQEMTTPAGKVVKTYPPVKKGRTPPLTADQRAALIQGYSDVVQQPQGTAYAVFHNTPLQDKDIAGKTGTAQVTGAGKQDTSVFTSFAPASDPNYEVTAFLEDSGYGASIAAPVVREIYDQIYGLPLNPVSYVPNTSGGGND